MDSNSTPPASSYNDAAAGNISGKSMTKAELIALIPPGSTVEYSTADKTICVIHDAGGGVVAILSDRAPGPVARRARLIACIPRLLSACPEATLAEVLACVSEEPPGESALWGWSSYRTPPAEF